MRSPTETSTELEQKKPPQYVLRFRAGAPEPDDPDDPNGTEAPATSFKEKEGEDEMKKLLASAVHRRSHDYENNLNPYVNMSPEQIQQIQQAQLFLDLQAQQTQAQPAQILANPEMISTVFNVDDLIVQESRMPVDKEHSLFDSKELQMIKETYPELYARYVALNQQLNDNATKCPVSQQELKRYGIRLVKTPMKDAEVINLHLIYIYRIENGIEYAMIDEEGKIERKKLSCPLFLMGMLNSLKEEVQVIENESIENTILDLFSKRSFHDKSKETQKALLVKQLKSNETWKSEPVAFLFVWDALQQVFSYKRWNPVNKNEFDKKGKITKGIEAGKEGRYVIYLIEEEQDKKEGKVYTNYPPLIAVIKEIRAKIIEAELLKQQSIPQLSSFSSLFLPAQEEHLNQAKNNEETLHALHYDYGNGK